MKRIITLSLLPIASTAQASEPSMRVMGRQFLPGWRYLIAIPKPDPDF